MSSGIKTNASAENASVDRQPVFEVRGITKVYLQGEVEVHALRGIDLHMAEGEFIVFLGHSGSGKSTLLNIMGGLDVPTNGTVHYRGRNITHFSERELTYYRREHVGFVFQFYNLIPQLDRSRKRGAGHRCCRRSHVPERSSGTRGTRPS